MSEILLPPKDAKETSTAKDGRWAKAFGLVHPGLITAASLVFASLIFLTDADWGVLFGVQAAVYKVIAGGILMFLLALFFFQELAIRQNGQVINRELERESTELKQMIQALEREATKD